MDCRQRFNVLIGLLLLVVASDSFAMRCGNRLVRVGDHQAEVLDRCGEPDWVEKRTALKANRLRHPYGALEIDRYEEIQIEEWTYNFGPRKFQQLLEFENGQLINIKELDYGF